MSKRVKKVAVSSRAIIQRINRKLAPEGEKLRTYRGGRWVTDLGRYYTINLNRNCILQTHLDLELFGRELGALREWETIADE